MMNWIFIGILWSGIFTGIGWSLYRNLTKAVNFVRRLHQVPCSNCIYFTDSCHLKCTVNPTTACSESAIDCRDFIKSDRYSYPKRSFNLSPYKQKLADIK